MIPAPDERKLWKHGLVRCQHKDALPVLILTAAGARAVREQCTACGKLDTAPLRLADHPAAPPVDHGRADAWLAARKEAGESAQAAAQKRYAMRQAAKVDESAEWFSQYDQYLGSDAWAAKRAMVLRRDQGRCQAVLPGCQRQADQVHHLGYAFHRAFNDTPLWLLVSICASCHTKATEVDRANRKR